MTHRFTLGLAALAAGCLGVAGTANAATYDAPRLLTATDQVQANAGTFSVALTPDGRFAVVYTAASNLYPTPPAPREIRRGAILRYDLDRPGSSPEVVAYDSSAFPGSQSISVSTRPSVSADGRLVVFSTAQKLIPTDGNGVDDVYVRDMQVPISDPAAFQLVSAVDGSATKPITYTLAQGGSTATSNAISADGTKVVFTVVAGSNVSGSSTPRRQVVLRDLTTRSTKVVSLGVTGKPVADQGQNQDLSLSPMISADGTTVVWNSASLWGSPQVPGLLPGSPYLETANRNVVWKRIADGPSAPVRLVLTPADPEDPACTRVVLTLSIIPGPCDSPLGRTVVNDLTSRIPVALSADGRRVVIATGNARANVLQDSWNVDAWVVDMRDGVSRKAGARRLTFGPGEATSAATVNDLALSPDGRFVAFRASQLTPKASPAAVGAMPSTIGTDNAYLIDLEADTVQLLSRTWSGENANANSYGLAISQDARRIAFLSDATNLFFGDGNRASDALVLTATSPTTQRPQDEETQATATSQIPAPLPGEQVTTDYRLAVTARARPDGTVQLSAVVPAAGRLAVSARERRMVRASTGKRVRAARRISADAAATATDSGRMQLVLTPRRSWNRQLRRAGGVPATITVRFIPSAGGAPISKTVAVTFRRSAATTARKVLR